MTDTTQQSTVIRLLREQWVGDAVARLRVTGNSMAPLVEQGDVVLVRQVNPGDVRRGDVLLLEQGGSFLVHRLVATDGHRLRTKGDNASHADPPVHPQDILGRVMGIEKDGKRIELDRGRWPMVNRLLGLLGWWEVQLFAVGRLARGRLVGAEGRRWTPGIASLAAAPFRWLTRLLLH